MATRPTRTIRNPQASKQAVYDICAAPCNPRISDKVLPATVPTTRTAKVSILLSLPLHRFIDNGNAIQKAKHPKPIRGSGLNASGNLLGPQLGRDSEMPGSLPSTSASTNEIYGTPDSTQASDDTPNGSIRHLNSFGHADWPSESSFGQQHQYSEAPSDGEHGLESSAGGSMDFNRLPRSRDVGSEMNNRQLFGTGSPSSFSDDQYGNYNTTPGPMTSLLMGEQENPSSFHRDNIYNSSGYQAFRMTPSKYHIFI